MKVVMSDEYRNQMEERERERRAQEAAHSAAREDAYRAWLAAARGWLPIETCPFAAYDDAYGYEGTIIVKGDGKVALATVSKRFGRPVKVIKAGEMVMVDGALMIEGAEYGECDHPDWWFEWELTDAHGMMNYASGHEIGKDEVDFMPTHWMPLPKP